MLLSKIDQMAPVASEERNFNTISPSAKSLLFMKGHTNIHFARRTAELINYPEPYTPDFDGRDLTFWARTYHFENRYWSIDQLMEELTMKNILELASGYSFRGLEKIKQKGVHYIDTDLPEVVKMKREIISSLQQESENPEGMLELIPLNALDEAHFREIASRFADGEMVIVNEGLMMYLDLQEKEKLCKIIHGILKERGGYWITADIYLKNKFRKLDLKLDDQTRAFFEHHRIEENRFESFQEAEAFFRRMGFVIDREAKVERSKLSSLKYLIKSATLIQLLKMRHGRKLQATWRLRVADK